MHHSEPPRYTRNNSPVGLRGDFCDSPPEAETGAPRIHGAHVGQVFDTHANIQTCDPSQTGPPIGCYPVMKVGTGERGSRDRTERDPLWLVFRPAAASVQRGKRLFVALS
jgi:hypothetical protein